jgi:AcrR family transcriptional regulator
VASKTNRRLTRDEVARAALDVLDREGLDALSMRSLAAELGVGTMTLYGYVRSKQELLDAAVDVAFSSWAPEPAEGEDWRARATAHALGTWRMLRRHPVIAQLRGRQPITRPQAYRVTEEALRILLDAGLPPDEATRAFRLVFTYVNGWALFGPEDLPPELHRAVRLSVAALPADEFPTLSTLATEIADTAGGEAQFRYGLELVMDAIQARVDALAGG